jgi:hypothetical protein
VNWNSQPFGTAVNNPASASRTSSIIVGTPAACANSTPNAYVSGWDVTPDVQAFVNGTAINNGWMIRDDVEDGAGDTVQFANSTQGLATASPQLIVTYR